MIKFDLSNRVAVITGGAQGFGFAIAERFIQSGAKVVIWDIDEQEAKKAVEKINSENISCLLYTSPSPRDRVRSRMPSSA